MTEQQTSIAPSSVVQGIADSLNEPPKLSELDAHLGSLLREVTRFKQAFTDLLAHTRNIEGALSEARDHLTGKDSQIASLKAQLERAVQDVTNKDTLLHDLQSQLDTLRENYNTVENHAAELARELAEKTAEIAGVVDAPSAPAPTNG